MSSSYANTTVVTNSAGPSPVGPILVSKLPDVGTTIFTTMSALAQTHGALNLSQRFPDFDVPPYFIDLVN